jgi:hypothetical protein
VNPNAPRDPTTRLLDLPRAATLAPLWLVLPAVLVALQLGWSPQDSWDLWWHMAAGRITDAQGSPADHINFLYTLPDAPAVNQPWLAQWLLYRAYDALGIAPLLILRNLMSAAAVFAITIAGWRRAQAAWAMLVPCLLAALFAASFIQLRAHLLVWPLFLLCLTLADAARRRPRTPRWIIPAMAAIAALWANLHGSFILPSLIALSFLAAAILDRWRAPERYEARDVAVWAATLAGCALATLLNPWGAGVWTFMLQTASDPMLPLLTSEWQPTTLSHPGDLGAMFWVTYLGGAGLMLRWRSRTDAAHALLLLGLGLLAARQCRALMWFGFALPLVLGPTIRAGLDHLDALPAPSPLRQRAARALAALLVLGALAIQPWAHPQRALMASMDSADARDAEPYLGLYLDDTPVEAIPPLLALRARIPHLRIHTAQRYAGFLIYHLQTAQDPWPMVSLDQRLESPPPALYAEIARVDAARGWQAFFARHAIHAALLRADDQAPLIAALDADPAWRRAAHTPQWSLFVRK